MLLRSDHRIIDAPASRPEQASPQTRNRHEST